MAESGQASILEIERVVRSYLLYADQDRPPAEDPEPVRDVKIRRGENGTGQVVITLSDLEIEEFAAALQAFIDLRYRPAPVDGSSCGDTDGTADQDPVQESSCGDPDGTDDQEAVHESSGEDRAATAEAPPEEASRPARKADAFIDLINAGLSSADRGHAAGDDRYMVHLVSRDCGRSYGFLDGRPVHPTDAARIRCDCSIVGHTVADGGEPLHLGRKTREWNTAQRRAISVRDGGHCRFPGCQFTLYDIHHMQSWEHDGPTDVSNGICECRRHHRMMHAGYQIKGDPNGELEFYRPNGTYVGSTYPAADRALCL